MLTGRLAAACTCRAPSHWGMTTVGQTAELLCRTCSLSAQADSDDEGRIQTAALARFLDEHDGCDLVMDLRGLRLPRQRAAPH